MSKRLVIIFISAFVLNVIWEHLHSVLYVSYQGREITNLILLKASLFDAVVITFIAYLTLSLFGRGRVGEGVSVLVLFIFAVILEKYALGTSRWVYTDVMPIIPLLNVGLTPAVQLGLLGYISLKISGGTLQ